MRITALWPRQSNIDPTRVAIGSQIQCAAHMGETEHGHTRRMFTQVKSASVKASLWIRGSCFQLFSFHIFAAAKGCKGYHEGFKMGVECVHLVSDVCLTFVFIFSLLNLSRNKIRRRRTWWRSRRLLIPWRGNLHNPSCVARIVQHFTFSPFCSKSNSEYDMQLLSPPYVYFGYRSS